MADIDVTIGTATVRLAGDMHRVRRGDGSHVRASVEFIFDDVLHAVTRVACAVVYQEDVDLVCGVLSDLRKQLAEREAERQGPAVIRTPNPEQVRR